MNINIKVTVNSLKVDKKFATQLGGAIGAGLLDAGMEAVFVSDPARWTNVFPFVPTIEPLPPADDWLVLGISAIAWGAGIASKNDTAKAIGEGMLAYSVPMIIGNTIIRAATGAGGARATARAGLPAGGKLAPKFIPSVLMPKYQYGNGNPGTLRLTRKARLAGGIYPQRLVPTRPGEAATESARQAITVGPYAGGITAPKFIPRVLRPKYQHGA